MTTIIKKATAALAGALLAAGISGAALGQDGSNYPNKPVTIIVNNQGPGPDTEVRLYIESIRQHGGPTYLVDYKLGAAGAVAMAYVSKAQPDGYTLMALPSSFITVQAVNDLGIDNVRDFTPISLLSKRFFMILVHPAAPFKTFKEYIDYARSHPGEINWSTSGIGASTHMPGELLHSMTKTKVTYIHYKNSAQRLVDLIAGRVHVTAGTALSSAGFVKAGKLRALVITGPVRSKTLPDVPTVAEAGLSGYEYSTWTGLLAPAKVPAYVATKNQELFKSSIKDPEVQKKLDDEETVSVMSTPDEFRQFIIAENKRWGKIIKDAGIKIEN